MLDHRDVTASDLVVRLVEGVDRLPDVAGRCASLASPPAGRLWGLLPYANEIPFFLRFHFDWTGGGRRVGTFDKVTRLRDRYVIEIDEPGLDRRLAIAQSVALDALQSR